MERKEYAIKKSILILTIIVLFLFLLVYTRYDSNKINKNESFVDNYNHLVETYNKVVVDFTKLANSIDSEINKNGNLEGLDRDSYYSLKEKILNNVDLLISQGEYYKYDLKFTKEINQLTSGINDYFEIIEEELLNSISNLNFEKIDEKYDKIYQNSIEIVESIDRIYENFQ